MPTPTPGPEPSDELYVRVDDEQYAELSQLIGAPIIHAAVWEESLVDALEPQPDLTTTAVDLDLYLRDGVYFELYGVVCYPRLDAEPLSDLAAIERLLQQAVREELLLAEVAVDDEDALVLVLAQQENPMLYLQVGAWLLDEWQELPDDAAS
jgi:hypothetical protein